MLLVIEFYVRASLEVASLIKKILSGTKGFKDDKLAIMWGVHSRSPTLAVIDGVLQLLNDPSQQQAHSQSPQAEKLHNLTWRLISKLTKNRLIFRDQLITYWPQAVKQVSSLFGVTSSERLPTIIQFLSTVTYLKEEELPLSDKIAIV